MFTCQQKAHPAADTCRPERQEFPRPQTSKRLSVQRPGHDSQPHFHLQVLFWFASFLYAQHVRCVGTALA
jgi:hypothetical protein